MKLLFVYDELMLQDIQELTNIQMDFVSYGLIKGKLYWVNDTKKHRTTLLPINKNTVFCAFGAIFVINDFEEQRLRIESYYGSSLSIIGENIQSDLYKLEEVVITPIKFNSLQDFIDCKFEESDKISCLSFVANTENSIVKNSLSKRRYYSLGNFDTDVFIKLIKERNKRYELE